MSLAINVALIAMASGARSAILRDAAPQLILATIAKERVNHAFLAPALLQMLMQAPGIGDADLSSMRSLTYGASPISEDLLKRASARFGCEFVQLYGMTETCGAGTFLPYADHDPAKGKLRSCGVAWPGVDLKIVSAEGAEVPRGAVGEVVIRSPVVMKGYWNKPDATAASIRDGWMLTGDAAYMDEDGYVFIYDRVKDMIVTGGGERLSGRGRECPVRSSGNRGCGCDRRPRRHMGRGGEGDRRLETRRSAGRSRHHRLGASAHRAFQGAEVGRFRRRHPAQSLGKDPEARIARALLERARPQGQLSSWEWTPRAAPRYADASGASAARPPRADAGRAWSS